MIKLDRDIILILTNEIKGVLIKFFQRGNVSIQFWKLIKIKWNRQLCKIKNALSVTSIGTFTKRNKFITKIYKGIHYSY